MGEVAEDITGNTGDLGLPILSISTKNGWMLQSERFSQVIAGTELNRYTELKKGQLSYNRGNSKVAEYGIVYELDDYRRALVPRVYHSFDVGENCSKFFGYMFRGGKADRELAKLVTSTARGDGLLNINKKDFYSIKINITNVNEQKRIGLMLDSLDNLITLYKRKLELLEEMKRYLLDVMFANEETRVPELRFEGFDGEWKQCRLRDVAENYNTARIPIAENKRVSGDIPYYGAGGIQDFVEGYTHDGNYILIAEDGASNLQDYPIYHVNGKIWANNHVHVLSGKINKATNSFLTYAFKNVNYYIYVTGSSRYKLTRGELDSIKVLLPKISEQNKIGNLLTKADDIISLYTKKSNSAESLKEFLLDNMFV